MLFGSLPRGTVYSLDPAHSVKSLTDGAVARPDFGDVPKLPPLLLLVNHRRLLAPTRKSCLVDFLAELRTRLHLQAAPETTWYRRMSDKTAVSATKHPMAPSGRAAKASSVGAKTVNGPGPVKGSTKSVTVKASTSVVKTPALMAVVGISKSSGGEVGPLQASKKAATSRPGGTRTARRK